MKNSACHLSAVDMEKAKQLELFDKSNPVQHMVKVCSGAGFLWASAGAQNMCTSTAQWSTKALTQQPSRNCSLPESQMWPLQISRTSQTSSACTILTFATPPMLCGFWWIMKMLQILVPCSCALLPSTHLGKFVCTAVLQVPAVARALLVLDIQMRVLFPTNLWGIRLGIL